MRGPIPGGRTPRPLAAELPAVFQEDPEVRALVEGLDEVLAPVFASLDCLDAYLDPRLAPADFLAGLAAWVGVPLPGHLSEQRRREAVGHAVELHRCRGTAWGLQWQLDLLTDGRAEVLDGGGVRWSRAPSEDGPAAARPAPLVVRVRRAGLSEEELDAIRDLVAWAKPAHVQHRVEVVDR